MEQIQFNKKELVESFLKKGLLLSADILKSIENQNELERVSSLLTSNNTKEILVLNDYIGELLDPGKNSDVNWMEFDRLRVLFEKGKSTKNYSNFLDYLSKKTEDTRKEVSEESKVKILYSYAEDARNIVVQDFAQHFYNRYSIIERISNAIL